MRLNKFIAITLPTSRRKADELIRNNLIRVNDMIAKIGDTVEENIDQVMYIDKKLIFSSDYKYFKFYKPAGYICSTKRQGESKTIYSIVKDRSLKYGGRLDKDSTGLLLLTNDGDLHHYLTHPKNEIIREYDVSIDRVIKPKEIHRMKKGVSIGEGEIGKANVVNQKIIKGRVKVRLILKQGKKREVRRTFRTLKIKLYSLKRVSFAGVELNGLKESEYRILNENEINRLRLGFS